MTDFDYNFGDFVRNKQIALAKLSGTDPVKVAALRRVIAFQDDLLRKVRDGEVDPRAVIEAAVEALNYGRASTEDEGGE
jgi:hypothetical protein